MFKKVRALVLTSVIGLGIGGSGTPAKAGFPTFDAIHTAITTVMSYLQYAQGIWEFDENIRIAKALYSTVVDFDSLSWKDAVAMLEIPWLDNIPGVDLLRDLGSVAQHLDEAVQVIYREVNYWDRMLNDEQFRNRKMYVARMSVIRTCRQRQIARRSSVKLAEHDHVKLCQKLTKDIHSYQAKIEREKKKGGEADISAIAAWESKIVTANHDMQASAEKLEQIFRDAQTKEEFDEKQLQEKLAEMAMNESDKANKEWEEYNRKTQIDSSDPNSRINQFWQQKLKDLNKK